MTGNASAEEVLVYCGYADPSAPSVLEALMCAMSPFFFCFFLRYLKTEQTPLHHYVQHRLVCDNMLSSVLSSFYFCSHFLRETVLV